jgi:hypothetical protein
MPSLRLPLGRSLGTLAADYARIEAMLAPTGRSGIANEKMDRRTYGKKGAPK